MAQRTNLVLLACGACILALCWVGSSFVIEQHVASQVHVPRVVQSTSGVYAQHKSLVSKRSFVARKDLKLQAGEELVQPLVAVTSEAASSSGSWIPVAAIAISLATLYFSTQKSSLITETPKQAEPAAPPALPQEELLAGRRPGARIDEVAMAVKEELAQRKNLTPRDVVLALQQGNARFWSGNPERPEVAAIERRALIVGQAPTVAILSCSDSRVPVEILFDQGLGSVFVVRVAGNILDSTATGSIEFAVKYLGVKVVLVMGHEGCGAVKGAMTMSAADIETQPIHLQTVLRSIKGNLNLDQLSRMRDSRSQDREAIVVNVGTQVKKLQQNPLIAGYESRGEVLVCGAFYEITSGIVDFFTIDKTGLVTDL